jgi:hypothetical protein
VRECQAKQNDDPQGGRHLSLPDFRRLELLFLLSGQAIEETFTVGKIGEAIFRFDGDHFLLTNIDALVDGFRNGRRLNQTAINGDLGITIRVAEGIAVLNGSLGVIVAIVIVIIIVIIVPARDHQCGYQRK